MQLKEYLKLESMEAMTEAPIAGLVIQFSIIINDFLIIHTFPYTENGEKVSFG